MAAALPTLTASYNGLVNGDQPVSLTTPPTLATTATAASHVGSYSITASARGRRRLYDQLSIGLALRYPGYADHHADAKSKLYGACIADADGQLWRLRQW